ncbi:GtrA family protein [Tsukamurella ocularis]|uniref:GtrA family protein n=1 Tax=Tsukamurella ocularis TaxID=1970234 RepID=UPI00286DE889|nr:GtrA family protein [Tsukamurella ocularis]MCS3779162.1 putative flippase GtrA [Tsukamurella ocularis]MCS3787218.1 putative flippase GtrA [Tsukamurella ocularis]MCS3852609.1 putative flippase GtrA [Tsukamurella ocularis]
MTTSEAADRVPLDLKTQLVRFVLTGGFSAVVDFGITLLLGKFLGLDEALAKTVGFVCGTTTAYLLNRRWTFQAEPSTKRMIAVWALYIAMYGVQLGIYMAFYTLFPPPEDGIGSYVNRLVAFVVAQGTATVVNFIVQRTVIFKLM